MLHSNRSDRGGLVFGSLLTWPAWFFEEDSLVAMNVDDEQFTCIIERAQERPIFPITHHQR